MAENYFRTQSLNDFKQLVEEFKTLEHFRIYVLGYENQLRNLDV